MYCTDTRVHELTGSRAFLWGGRLYSGEEREASCVRVERVLCWKRRPQFFDPINRHSSIHGIGSCFVFGNSTNVLWKLHIHGQCLRA